jgi:hypothetical protein
MIKWANEETLLRKHCFLPMFRHVSKSGQTLGNISEKHRETSNVSEFARKHFCFSGSKFCFRNNVSTGGQTGKHRESQMFPQQRFLVCPGPNCVTLMSDTGCRATCVFYRKKYFSPLRILKYNKSNIDNMHQGSPHPMVNTDVKKSTTRGVGTIRRIHALPENGEHHKLIKSGVPDWLKMHSPYNICYIILVISKTQRKIITVSWFYM